MASDEAQDFIKNLIERFTAMSEEEKNTFLGLHEDGEYGKATSLDEALEKFADELGKECPNAQCICKKEKEE